MVTRHTAEIYRLSDYKKIRDNFLEELIRASKDQPSSISYIRHTFPNPSIIKSISPKAMSEAKPSRMVQAFVIGGTNFVSGIARLSKNGTLKELQKERKQGKTPTFADAATFLKFIKKHCNPKAEAIAINFAYKLDPLNGKFGEVDGILTIGTKEHLFAGLLGKPIGETIRIYIKRNIPITVVNDTVCLGKNGLVVGSGCNFSLESVNLEAGNFNKFPASMELEAIDKRSTNPGGHRFEKMISGTYLPFHFNLLAKRYDLKGVRVADGKELSHLAEHDKGPAGDLARMLLSRSASLVASALAASYQFVNKKTLEFTTEGSMFWQGFGFEETVKEQLLNFGVPKGAIRFKNVEDSSLQGAFSLLTRTK